MLRPSYNFDEFQVLRHTFLEIIHTNLQKSVIISPYVSILIRKLWRLMVCFFSLFKISVSISFSFSVISEMFLSFHTNQGTNFLGGDLISVFAMRNRCSCLYYTWSSGDGRRSCLIQPFTSNQTLHITEENVPMQTQHKLNIPQDYTKLGSVFVENDVKNTKILYPYSLYIVFLYLLIFRILILIHSRKRQPIPKT